MIGTGSINEIHFLLMQAVILFYLMIICAVNGS